MFGGSGADLFVICSDGQTDTIMDFDPSQDRLDLSLTPMLYGPSQIAISETNQGLRLQFRGENLDLRPAAGVTLTEAV